MKRIDLFSRTTLARAVVELVLSVAGIRADAGALIERIDRALGE